MVRSTHIDANIALTMIFMLMVSLLGMNTFYFAHQQATGEVIKGVFPVSSLLASFFVGLSANSLHVLHEICWWAHILLIFLLPICSLFKAFSRVSVGPECVSFTARSAG